MKKDLDTLILNMDFSPAMLQADVPLTIKHCIQECLLATTPGMTAEEKSRRWQLCQKTRKGGSINITIDEGGLIKKAAAEVHSILVYGQIEDWLNETASE